MHDRKTNLGEKVTDQQLKSSADMVAVGVNHWNTGNQCSEESKTETRPVEAGAIMSTEKRTVGLSGTGAQVSLCNRHVIRVEDSIINGNGAQLSLCKDDGTGAQVSSESGTRAHFYLNSGISGHISESVSTDSECGSSKVEIHDAVENQTDLTQPQEVKDLACPTTNEPKKSISCVETTSAQAQPKQTPLPNPQSPQSNSAPSKESASLPPSRPKEPFCRVLSRDGSRVLLWPTEMVSYTKTSPSISYSVNPLLYDFRAHNRAKEGGEKKKGGLEEGGERIKPSVIKQPDCQQRQKDMKGGKEVKIDEREEEDEGGQAGNPMELVAHCSGSDAVPDRSSCHDESALKFVPISAEGHHAPTLGLQKSGRRRRKRRGGVRRGMRKRGRKKRGEETDRKESERGKRIISSLCVNQMFEGKGEDRLQREGTVKEEKREKELLSNLAAHRLVGGIKKRMRGEERRIRRDQTEQERAGRNDEKRGELLSNLPVNRCNRCNQLCLQVKREASQHQSQQSASGWGQGLRKLHCRDAACNSVISLVPGSVIEMPCCPAITPDPAQNDREMGVIHKNTQAGKEDRQGDEEQRNLSKGEISAAPKAEENACNPAISCLPFSCCDTASQAEICLVPKPHRETACKPTISLVPAPFRETACSQRQTIPAGHSNLVSSPTTCCSAQQTETEPRLRPACVDMTLPADALSEEGMSKRAATASKRKSGSPEAGATPRKKRKRGRRQARRVASVLRQDGACTDMTSDLNEGEACCIQDGNEALELNSKDTCNTSEDKTVDCHLLCRTKHSLCSNTREGNTADKLDNYCSSDDSKFSNADANDYSQFNVGPSGGEEKVKCSPEKPFSDCHTNNKPNDHSQDDGKGTMQNKRDSSAISSATFEKDKSLCHGHVAKKASEKTADTPVDGLSEDYFACSTNNRHTDHCQCKNTVNEIESNDSKANDAFSHNCDYSQKNNKSDHSEEEKAKSQCHIRHKNSLSDSVIDYKSGVGIQQSVGGGADDIDGGQCDDFNGNHVTDCNHCANAVNEEVAPVREQMEDESGVEKERKKEEEKQMERKKLKERHEEWEKEWVRRKEKEREERSKEREIDFEPLFPEKMPRFPHRLPPSCIHLHPPLLLQPSFSSSSSSSISFHHTIIQHHLSLLPPAPHLPVPSYPHLIPSFSPHLSPIPPPPPPPPLPPPPALTPTFYASSPIPLLDAPGPYPLAAAFHPVQSHHPSLYPTPHPAVLPLQLLF